MLRWEILDVQPVTVAFPLCQCMAMMLATTLRALLGQAPSEKAALYYTNVVALMMMMMMMMMKMMMIQGQKGPTRA